MTLVRQIRVFMSQLDGILKQIIDPNKFTGMPALCTVETPLHSHQQSGQSSGDLLSTLLDPLMRMVVPRNRRSIEKRQRRRNLLPEAVHAKPKKNIIICLECGHPHESQTICGNCYNKVKAASKHLQDILKCEDTMNKNIKEVAFLYKNEVGSQFPHYRGRHLVEVDQDRPSWFSKELMKKYKGEN